ncbi:MAG: OmpH family outer membrane protein [Nitrospirae bacterium]|nr:OmpH family outer membrane protein [Nitrospirota bacterium]
MKISGIKKVFAFTAVTGMIIYAFTASPVRAEEFKIGYVDAQKVLDESTLGQRVKESLNEYVQSRQKIVDIEETELKKLEEDLSKQGAVLSPEAKQDKEEQLQRKYMEYQKKVGELQKEIQLRRTEKLEEFNKNLEKIVKIFGEKDGYSMILNNPASNTVMYSKPSLDLTEQLIKEIDKNITKEAPKTEKDK